MPPAAVTLQTGYEDEGAFARLFKRSVGLTPAQHRRRLSALREPLGGVRQG
jgi:AraC-like DNA-binding protein